MPVPHITVLTPLRVAAGSALTPLHSCTCPYAYGVVPHAHVLVMVLC